jgi:hypothetical protein
LKIILNLTFTNLFRLTSIRRMGRKSSAQVANTFTLVNYKCRLKLRVVIYVIYQIFQTMSDKKIMFKLKLLELNLENKLMKLSI